MNKWDGRWEVSTYTDAWGRVEVWLRRAGFPSANECIGDRGAAPGSRRLRRRIRRAERYAARWNAALDRAAAGG